MTTILMFFYNNIANIFNDKILIILYSYIYYIYLKKIHKRIYCMMIK
jgi:hypothetical protein